MVDARGEEVSLDILIHGEEAYEKAPSDEQGYRFSKLLNAKVRLVRRRGRAGLAVFRLEVEPK